MTELEKIIYITNNIIIKKIKKQIYNIKKSKLDNQIKNNLIMSGEILINIYKDYQKNNVFYGTLQLRNVFEGTLKAITLDKSEEIKKSLTHHACSLVIYGSGHLTLGAFSRAFVHTVRPTDTGTL